MKISFLASHGGSTAKFIMTAIRKNRFDAEIGVVITNNINSNIYNWCRENSTEIVYISGNKYPVESEKDKAICETLISATEI